MTKARQNKAWLQQFMLVLAGQGFSLLGSGLVQFAIIWWLTRETGSAIVLTAAAIFGLLPMIFISPFAGAIADRVNRKTILMVADGFVALISLLMAVLFYFGTLQLWLVYLFMMLRSAGAAFHQPAFEAAMPQIAPVRHLVRVNSALQFIRSGVNLAAPLLGAILIESFSLQLILLVDVITAAIAIALLLPIQILDVRQPDAQLPNLRVYLHDMRAGLRYIRSWRGLNILILVFAFTNFLLSPLVTLMALIVSKHFNGGALEYSYVQMMLAGGILLGSLAITAWGGFDRKILNINFGQILSGVALIVAGFLPSNALMPFMFCMLICGISSCFVNAPAMAIVQSQVNPEMLGRVMSIVSALCMVAMPLSLILAGPLAEVVGLMPLIYVPGIISGLLGIVCFFIPDIMNIEAKTKTAVKTAVPEI